MNSLVLSSPDFFDRNFADLFDQSPELQAILPSSGIAPDYLSGSPQSRIYSLHQKILVNQQKTWFQPLSSKRKVLDFGEYEDELDSILEAMGSGWLIQDGLLNHFLPLWLSRAANPVLFLYYSDPLECALTLQKKWRFPISFGLALWENYILSAANNLIGHPWIPVSINKLRQSPQAVIKSVLKQIRDISQEDNIPVTDNEASWSSLLTKPQADLGLYSEFLQDSQKDIFSCLENGEIKQLEGRVPSLQSTDILDYYGQLRAGFEMLKTKHSQFAEHTDPKNSEHTVEKCSTSEPPETGAIPETSSTLREVTVHIRGMEPLEFIVEADSPILQMLWHSLQSSGQTPDEMVYLDYKDNATSALYFMKSSLQGIESTPLLH